MRWLESYHFLREDRWVIEWLHAGILKMKLRWMRVMFLKVRAVDLHQKHHLSVANFKAQWMLQEFFRNWPELKRIIKHNMKPSYEQFFTKILSHVF